MFAVRQMFAIAATPLAFLFAGALSERVFQPLLSANGLIGDSMTWLVGSGEGRGIAFLLSVMGVAVVVISIALWRSAAIRNLDRHVPNIASDPGRLLAV